MADSSVPITAGTGTSIDTRTEGTNGHHRQVMVLGDPASNAGVAPVDENNGLLVDIAGSEYETVAASQTEQTLGATGGSGDLLAGVLVIPASTSPGTISIKDGSNSAITVFNGGTDSVSNLVPFMIPLGLKSTAGAWQITTGANVSAIGIGTFT